MNCFGLSPVNDDDDDDDAKRETKQKKPLTFIDDHYVKKW